MEIITTYEIVKEATKVLRWIDRRMPIKSFNPWSKSGRFIETTVPCVVIDRRIEETQRDQISDKEIDTIEQINAVNPFDSEFVLRPSVNITGTMLALSRYGHFIEYDIIGDRNIPTLECDDIDVQIINPANRDISFIIKKYPNINELLINALVYHIQLAIYKNPKKMQTLSRLIEFIKKEKNADDSKASDDDDQRERNELSKKLVNDQLPINFQPSFTAGNFIPLDKALKLARNGDGNLESAYQRIIKKYDKIIGEGGIARIIDLARKEKCYAKNILKVFIKDMPELAAMPTGDINDIVTIVHHELSKDEMPVSK